MYGRRGKYLNKDWKPVAKKAEAPADTKTPKWYPAEDLPSRRVVVKPARKPGQLRESITPGTILILLAGRFAGRRVVFLKQLESGLLLVSGPFTINGVPLRRVNQAYVIATSTSVDVSKVSVPENVNDAYFKAPKKSRKSGKFFAEEEKPKNTVSEERKADQKKVDEALVAAVKATEGLDKYLSTPFTLTNGQFPHAMNF
uniref:Large ribosomal subunit protein eL6 n=1 Tax=Vannella robusta TaxID=1487602 RepID=A0A7S4HS97_9EUKA